MTPETSYGPMRVPGLKGNAGIICYSREPGTRFRAKSPVNAQVTNSQNPIPKAQSPKPKAQNLKSNSQLPAPRRGWEPGVGDWRVT